MKSVNLFFLIALSLLMLGLSNVQAVTVRLDTLAGLVYVTGHPYEYFALFQGDEELMDGVAPATIEMQRWDLRLPGRFTIATTAGVDAEFYMPATPRFAGEVFLKGQWVESIAIDSHNNKWLGTKGGLAKFDGVNWTVFNTSNSQLPSDEIKSLAINGSSVWVGTTNGLAKFDGSDWTIFNTSNSQLPSDEISSLAVDGSTIWVGTRYGGLAKFNGSEWCQYGVGSVNVVYASGGNVLVGTWDGLYKLDSKSQWNKIAAGYIDDMTVIGGDLYISSYDGLRKVNAQGIEETLVSGWTQDVVIQGSKALVSLFHAGLVVFDIITGEVQTYNIANSELPDNYVRSIAISPSDQAVWVGTWGGLLKLQGEIYSEVSKTSPEATLPQSFSLEQNYPNPFNPTTTIRYSLEQACHVSLKVCDITGRLVDEVYTGLQASGQYTQSWSGAQFPSGTYLLVLEASPVWDGASALDVANLRVQRAVRKMTLVK